MHREVYETPEGAGSGAAGVACTGPGSRPPFAWSSETFGSYKTKGARSVCLHNYSDFLLSETVDWVTPC
ncbi:hypothetical protein GCM10010228_31090 [Streptomyces massasporeus]|nr:hypothetical protein GCM10010228_31090 [Streptomyces massasporeus]